MNPQLLLTPAETRIVRLLAKGKKTGKIAASLGRSIKTVQAHCASARRKLGLSSMEALRAFAARNVWT